MRFAFRYHPDRGGNDPEREEMMKRLSTQSVRELEERIAELKRRIPPHSVPPAMLQELEELEDQLEQAREAGNAGAQKGSHGGLSEVPS